MKLGLKKRNLLIYVIILSSFSIILLTKTSYEDIKTNVIDYSVSFGETNLENNTIELIINYELENFNKWNRLSAECSATISGLFSEAKRVILNGNTYEVTFNVPTKYDYKMYLFEKARDGVAVHLITIPIQMIDTKFTPKITERTTYNKVNDLDEVLLKTSDKTYLNNIQEISFVFQNKTNNKYTFGERYYLEKFENNEWYQLSNSTPEYDRVWDDIGYILEPNSKREEKINMDWIYGNNYDSGKYRIVKDIIYSRKDGYDQFYLTAEFDIIDK